MARLDRDARRAAMLASPLFHAMGPETLDAVLEHAIERSVGRGRTIFQRGDPGSSIMAVLHGRVRIGSISPEGREVVLNIINPGEVFGEIALLDGKPRSADATATEDTLLLALERRHFLPFLEQHPDVMLRLIAVLCERLRGTSVAMEELVMLDLPQRLARLLLKLGDNYGRRIADGLRIDFKLSQKDISNLVASSRESVNKQMRTWHGEGVLDMQGGYIVLRQPGDLEQLLSR